MPSRRSEIQMSEPELERLMDEERVVTVATVMPNGRPHLMPLWYVHEGTTIVGWTFGKSQKVKNLERDPRATLQIEAGDQYGDLRGAMLECDVTIERDPARVAEIGVALIARYSGVAPTPEALAGVRKQAGKRVGLRFTPTRVVSWDHRKLGGAY
jgi:PPOX class probable F420-dependent enzyme